jgi:hypothetical protein
VFTVKEPGFVEVAKDQEDWLCKREDLAGPVSLMAVGNVRIAAAWVALMPTEIPLLVPKKMTSGQEPIRELGYEIS